MSSDNKEKQREAERAKLLEEIRKRAEEAELRRIEEQERNINASSSPDSQTDERSQPSSYAPRMTVREKLTIALAERDLFTASNLFAEFVTLFPDDPILPEFRRKVAELQQHAVDEKRSATSSKSKKKAPVRTDKSSKEALGDARNEYQDERYDSALAKLNKILSSDPENEEALALKEEVQKAKSLSEKIKEEEARQHERESEKPSPPVAAPREMKQEESVPEMESREPEPEPVDEIQREEPKEVRQLPPKTRTVRRPRKRRVTGILVGLAILAGLIIGYTQFRHVIFNSTPTLVVVPLPSDDSLDFSVEAAVGLIDELSRIEGLKVVGATTSLQLTPSQLQRGAGIQYYVDISAAVNVESMHVSVTVFDTISGGTMILKRSSRDLTGRTPAVLHMAAGTIADTLRVTAFPSDPLIRVPVDPDAYILYGRARAARIQNGGELADGIIQDLREAAALDPTFAEARTALADMYIRAFEEDPSGNQSLLDSAYASLREAIALGSISFATSRTEGIIQFRRGDGINAVATLENARRLAPNDPETHRRLAIAYLQQGRTDNALQSVRFASSLDPYNVDVQTTLGEVQQVEGDLRSALLSYDKAARRSGDSTAYRSGLYSDVLVYLQKHMQAIVIQREMLARDPLSYVEHYKLGRIYQRSGVALKDWQDILNRGKNLAEEYLRMHPDDPVALSYLALIETRLGNFKRAIATSRRAVEIDPENAKVLYNTARMYALQQDKKKEALEYLKRAIDKFYRLRSILDLDFYGLQSDPGYRQLFTKQ